MGSVRCGGSAAAGDLAWPCMQQQAQATAIPDTPRFQPLALTLGAGRCQSAGRRRRHAAVIVAGDLAHGLGSASA
jgi:hypothetical protein